MDGKDLGPVSWGSEMKPCIAFTKTCFSLLEPGVYFDSLRATVGMIPVLIRGFPKTGAP